MTSLQQLFSQETETLKAEFINTLEQNYLASPPLVVAYALAGRVDIDFETEPIGKGKDGKDVYLRDIWPTREQVSKISKEVITPDMFRDNYEKIADGNKSW